MRLMSRGGKRDNAGRKSGWVNPETKLIRVPVAIESDLMAIAKKLDQGETFDLNTKSNEIESVTESNLDFVTDSIKEIVDRYRKESDKSAPKNTKWDNARRLLKELELVLYDEGVLDSVTESNLEENEIVTDSKVENDFVTVLESDKNETVTDSKNYRIEQFELIPSIAQQSILEPLKQSDLADRLGSKNYQSQISIKKSDHSKFADWSKSKDPDGIAWEYHADTKKYYPLNP